MVDKKPLSSWQYAVAIWKVAAMSARTSPFAVVSKFVSSIVSAILPLVTTYFAALTTTELASAFAGNEASGKKAITYVVITVALGFVMLVWNSIDQYAQQMLRFKVEAKVSDMMYEKFHQLDFWRYDDKATIDLYDKAQQFSQFYAYVFDRVFSLMSNVIALVSSIIALMVVVPWIGLIIVLAVLPAVYTQFRLSRFQVRHWGSNVSGRRSRSFIEWNLFQPDAIAELRLNNMVGHLLGIRRHLRDEDEKKQLEFERTFMPRKIASDALQALAELISLIWIVVEIINRQQPIGQFIYVQQIVSRALSSVSSFVSGLSTIDEDLANLGYYQEFMELDNSESHNRNLTQSPQLICFEDVSFSYPGSDRPVLENISFEIKVGEHIAIVGENGAGKSTLVKLLCGLYRPTSGKVTFDGVDISEINPSSWHRYIAVLGQDFLKYKFTSVKDNILFGDISNKYDERNYQSALENSESSEFVDDLPQKDRTLLNKWFEDIDGKPGTDLSGGQWQRLALARSFYRNAPFLIFDEPTSAIDAIAEARIFKKIFSVKNRKTIVVISHRMTTIKKADTIYMLDDGKIVEKGSHSELITRNDRYVRMFESQLEGREDPPAR